METEYTNRLVDIIHEGIDVAIRVGNLPDSGLSARKLGEISYGLYAAPNYLKNSPILTKVTDLGGHQLIAKTNSGRSSWTLLNGIHSENIEISVRAGVSSILTAKNLALSGIGIAQLPRFLAEPYVKDELLSLVLPGWAHAPVPVNAVFASSRYMDPKVRSFVDLCISSFRDSMVVSVT
jgi:DNA-binding transcriptional LysR family regulator